VSEDLARLDATAQAELVRIGEVSPEELTQSAIARAERLNPDLNAIIHPLYEQGLAESRGELPDGPFRGVPFLFKDLGAGLAGQPLHMGMKGLKDADFHLPLDTFLGARFREAGFVTIGKTNTPELGIVPTTEPAAYGPTHNPWNLDHSPGGSSGGSAAAVAAGIVPIAHANDGGGSIRIPASCCGLVGLKPSRGRTSLGPLIGDTMSGLTVEHVVSRSVRDVAAALDATHGPGPGDPYVAPAPARPYMEELSADPGSLRIAILTDPVGAAHIEIA
jgi:amidase